MSMVVFSTRYLPGSCKGFKSTQIKNKSRTLFASYEVTPKNISYMKILYLQIFLNLEEADFFHSGLVVIRYNKFLPKQS